MALTPKWTDPMSRGRTQRSVCVKGTAFFTGALIERRSEIVKVLAVREQTRGLRSLDPKSFPRG